MTVHSLTPPVIVVEDSDEDFDTVMQAVEKSGIPVEILRASTGGDCLSLLRAKRPLRPAVILLDLNTAGVDGREALAAIKSDEVLKIYPVVVFSTSADPRDLTFCYEAGANAYHVKPVRYPEHLQLVAELINYWLGKVALPGGVDGQ